MGCGAKETREIPVIVEQKTPTIFTQETPYPDPPVFQGATNMDLLNYSKDLENRLQECNNAKAKMR